MDVNSDAFFIPEEREGERVITLARSIIAIQLIKEEDGTAKLGLLAQLGPGTKVCYCGGGFNDRTVKVRADGGCYFVFSQDLETQSLAMCR